MTSKGLARTIGTAAAVAGLAATAAISGASPAAHSAAAKAKITRQGVDGVRLHMRYTTLRKRHLVHKIRHGCELGGANTRSARLVKPIKGQVNFTLHNPRRVTDITIRGGAEARGVGIGDTSADILQQYPNAQTDHSTDHTFGVTLVRTPKRHGSRITFAIDTGTHRITLIGVPQIAFCD
jgi:hypothetical protein